MRHLDVICPFSLGGVKLCDNSRAVPQAEISPLYEPANGNLVHMSKLQFGLRPFRPVGVETVEYNVRGLTREILTYGIGLRNSHQAWARLTCKLEAFWGRSIYE